MQTLATPDACDASTSSRPFSATRSGLVLGEGAAILILEAREQAEARRATVYAELAGAGLSCDASHLTKPDSAGQIAALNMALAKSGLSPEDVGYCNAHGTATLVGDVVESASLRSVWGDALSGLRVSSSKSMHGHLLGAAGALEALITVLAIHNRLLPPNAHCADQDSACNIPLVRPHAEAAPGLEAAISNSFAFGGTNSVLVFRRPC
jgi:3-oxoacyl-[acyl-carrier-protein] synthase II